MRQFLAIELSSGLREELRSLQQRLRPIALGWRWVRPESIHLTLRFLGEVSTEIDAACREAWREVAAAAMPFAIRLDGIGSFPPRGRPRVLWVGIEETGSDGRLAGLAASFETTSREVGFAAENRAFRPHLTLARVQRHGRAGLPDSPTVTSGSVLDVRDAVLYRSELLPTGARYVVLDRFALGGP